MHKTNPCTVIAIDGGAATGKSSTARALAEQLDFMHVDTGAHYRSLTAALRQLGVTPSSEATVVGKLTSLKLGTQLRGRSALLSINDRVLTEAAIRAPEVTASVSLFAAFPSVRQFLFDYQRGQVAVATQQGYAGLIMEGRDIGSVIFPDADHRFFLHADAATRAARRANEGLSDSITQRDQLDRTRKAAPLVCPEGATQIDTGPLPLEGVVQQIRALINVQPHD